MANMLPFVSRADASEQAVWINTLAAVMPNETLVRFDEMSDEQKHACDVAVVANPDPQDLMALPNLKWVHSVWAGVERMINELSAPPFSIVRLVDSELSSTMSEAVLAWTLFLHRDMPAYRQQQAQALWLQRPMVRAKDRRIGILGLGELGRVSAQRLLSNGFSVAGWSRNAKQIEGMRCLQGEEGLSQLLSQSDILVCLLPLTKQTKGLLDKKALSVLPSGAGLINFARGPIMDDSALLEALDQGHVSHAVLDVFMQEPLPVDHAYWRHSKVSVLPHISAPTHPESACTIVADNLSRYRLKGIIPQAIDLSRGY